MSKPKTTNRATQQRNQWKTGLVVLVALSLLGAFLWWLVPNRHASIKKPVKPAFITTTDIADFNQSATGEALEQLQTNQTSLQAALAKLRQHTPVKPEQQPAFKALQQEVKALQQQLKTAQQSASTPPKPAVPHATTTHPLPGVVPTQPHLVGAPRAANPMTLASLYAPRAFHFDYVNPAEQAEQGCTPDNCVLPGTFAKAVLLGAADANASVNGQSNTTPIEFRILDNGVLPNGYHSSLKGCFVIGEVYGDISSERGEVKLSTISCIKHGKTITRNINGTAYDIGGKEGVRGRPVMRNGKLLAYAGASGFLSGIGSALQQQYTTQSISPLGSTSTVDNNKVFQYGAAQGAETALAKLSDYYIKRADQFHPIIEINAGSVVDLVFLTQFQLLPDDKPAGAKPTRTLSSHYWSGQAVTHPTSLASLNQFSDRVPSDQVNQIQSQMSQMADHVKAFRGGV